MVPITTQPNPTPAFQAGVSFAQARPQRPTEGELTGAAMQYATDNMPAAPVHFEGILMTADFLDGAFQVYLHRELAKAEPFYDDCY